MKLFKKGTMQPIRKIVGVLLLVMAAGMLFNIQQILSVIANLYYVKIAVMAAAGYFLLISGRR